MARWLTKLVCVWFHGGGQIERDDQGRINWRCARCGRWSDNPVPLASEGRILDKPWSDATFDYDFTITVDDHIESKWCCARPSLVRRHAYESGSACSVIKVYRASHGTTHDDLVMLFTRNMTGQIDHHWEAS